MPIQYHPRREGSKFLPYRETLRILRHIIRTMFRLDCGKVALPLAALFFVPGSLWTVYQAAVRGKITAVPLLIALAGLAIGLFGILARRPAFKAKGRPLIS